MDKEAELLKIQIFADYCHSQFNIYFTIYMGILITGTFFILTALIENLLSVEFDGLILVFLFVAISVVIYYLFNEYERNINLIFKKIDALVEKNELPNLEKLKWM
jgi:hypothetical protein